MATYTLHLPRDARPGDPAALDKAELVKDAFSWGAFFFTVLWFFAHRLWIAGLGVLLAFVAFDGALDVLNVHPTAAVAAHLLFSCLIGLEANSLRRWTLARNGRPVVDVVTASDRDEAETKAFARWLERTAPVSAPSRPVVAPNRSARGPEPVLGLFPDVERFR
ncbi:DUF2628 domain-containing protein [Microvirga alba]|uniref:DUF2628 domain-containing protein n=1 Tax=Microvirga alba TaxID=2791025 RepID=A0A931BR68_9HYPH|nr:DUF2628 domain-containing protein [Microvirga alba]MBF9233118.1 DUF2628 domain-containing protein [Microvirga alba]